MKAVRQSIEDISVVRLVRCNLIVTVLCENNFFMNSPNVDYFRARYQAMDEDEFSSLAERAIRNPESLSEAAIHAVNEIVAQRRLNSVVIVQSQIQKRNDQTISDNHVRQKKSDKEAQSNRRLEVVLSYLGLTAAGLVGMISLVQMEWKGLATALVVGMVAGYTLFQSDKNK